MALLESPFRSHVAWLRLQVCQTAREMAAPLLKRLGLPLGVEIECAAYPPADLSQALARPYNWPTSGDDQWI